MTSRFAFLALAMLVSSGRQASADVPAQKPNSSTSPTATTLVGNWSVEFTNGVKQVCNVPDLDGKRATVEEPGRSSGGAVAMRAGSYVITYRDDRLERWTPVGPRFIVEHWFPASGFPSAAPVLGIADRLR